MKVNLILEYPKCKHDIVSAFLSSHHEHQVEIIEEGLNIIAAKQQKMSEHIDISIDSETTKNLRIQLQQANARHADDSNKFDAERQTFMAEKHKYISELKSQKEIIQEQSLSTRQLLTTMDHEFAKKYEERSISDHKHTCDKYANEISLLKQMCKEQLAQTKELQGQLIDTIKSNQVELQRERDIFRKDLQAERDATEAERQLSRSERDALMKEKTTLQKQVDEISTNIEKFCGSNANMRGIAGEQMIENMIETAFYNAPGFTLRSVRKIPGRSDLLITLHGLEIMIECKNTGGTVRGDEVEKFTDQLRKSRTAQAGILISLSAPIPRYTSIQLLEHNKLLFQVQHFMQTSDPILHLHMISHLLSIFAQMRKESESFEDSECIPMLVAQQKDFLLTITQTSAMKKRICDDMDEHAYLLRKMSGESARILKRARGENEDEVPLTKENEHLLFNFMSQWILTWESPDGRLRLADFTVAFKEWQAANGIKRANESYTSLSKRLLQLPEFKLTKVKPSKEYTLDRDALRLRLGRMGLLQSAQSAQLP